MKKGTVNGTDAAGLRRQAESMLRKQKKKASSAPMLETDSRRLVHELEVHQIELELQNEELAQARLELEALLRQYTDLYDFAPVGYFTLGRDGTIQQANLAGANLLGAERSTIIQRRFGSFVSTPSHATFKTFLEKVFGSRGRETCDIALFRKGLPALWTRIEASLVDGQSETARVIVIDISVRKQMEEQLRYLGSHDALTGLFNRSFFMEEMARLENGRDFPISIVMADLDQLKNTNDEFGHAAGDELLKRIAQVLTKAFRGEDVVARIGGDEFSVLLPRTDAAEAEILLHRVRLGIEADNAAHSGSPIRLSFGASTSMTHGFLSGLLQEADANMYHNKAGRDDPKK